MALADLSMKKSGLLFIVLCEVLEEPTLVQAGRGGCTSRSAQKNVASGMVQMWGDGGKLLVFEGDGSGLGADP